MDDIKTELKKETALVAEIRTQMRSASGIEKQSLYLKKIANRPLRRHLCLSLAYLNCTPYVRAESKCEIPPSSRWISKLLNVDIDEINRWIGGETPERKPTLKLYVVTRSDLPAGARAVQSAHALIEFASNYPDIEQYWHQHSNILVLLEAKDEEHLKGIIFVAGVNNVPFACFHEPDLNNSLTAIALGPGAGKLDCIHQLPLALNQSAVPLRPRRESNPPSQD